MFVGNRFVFLIRVLYLFVINCFVNVFIFIKLLEVIMFYLNIVKNIICCFIDVIKFLNLFYE